MQNRKNKVKRVSIVFLLPSLLGISIFVLIPFVDVVRRSFVSAMGNKFVGWQNYKTIFANEAFKLAAKNTALLLITCLPILLFASLILALMLYSVVEKAGFLKTAFMLPMSVPVACVVLLWKAVFNNQGLANSLLSTLGYSTISWMDSSMAFWVLVGSFIWKNLGYNVVLWMAGLADISPSLYEAAEVDGAGKVRSFFYITLPGLLPCLFTMVVLSLVNFFKIFREAWLVAGSYPHSSIYILQHTFNNWFRDLSIDKLSAAAVVVALVSLSVILIMRKAWDKNEF